MKKYIRSDTNESVEYLKELVTDMGNLTNEGIKYATEFNENSGTEEQADLSGQIRRAFEAAQDLIDELSQEI